MYDFKKRGLVFSPTGNFDWMKTHAQVPTILDVDADRYRVYFSSRPNPKISLTGFVDVSKKDPTKVLYTHEKPILELGAPGTFDEFGIMPSTVIRHNGAVYMYYTGWSRGTTVPYLNAIGLAISEDNGMTFRRYSRGPVVERTKHEPFSAMSPYVYKELDKWHMWYSSGTDWHKVGEKYEPIYLIKYAHSDNGIDWVQTNQQALPSRLALEANTRPTVIRLGDTYHMWFCYRGGEDYRGGRGSYRIGYATSNDLVNWDRDDKKCGIDISADGFDSIMVEYPQIVAQDKKLLMFYNGNGFGEQGFALAEATL